MNFTRLHAEGWSLLRRLALIALLVCVAAHAWARDANPPTGILDLHVHVAGIGAGGSGCFVSEALRDNYRFWIYLRAMGVKREELEKYGDALVVERLSEKLSASSRVNRAVILAIDGAINSKGELDHELTEVYVPNKYVAAQARAYPNLLFGASVNPARPDALERLEEVRRDGAVLIKWIPSIMMIDPADPAHRSFYSKLVKLGLPLLTHTGMERSFSHARDEFADPRRLELPLSLGVTVIAAHIASTGESDGEDNFERILPMFDEYPNLYADISSLTQINKLGYLVRALAHEEVRERLVYGTDWPLQFIPLISPWYHLRHIGLSGLRAVWGAKGAWDRDVALKEAMGAPAGVFLRAENLLPHIRAMHH
jgi:hypothetical protein